MGFEPLLSFPKLDEVYESGELPPLFSNRLMPRSRPEFASYLGELGLSAEHAEPFTVLARSGGRRTTDRLEVFAPAQKAERGYEGLFLARGVRHVPGSESAVAELQAGGRLYVMADVQNEVNAAALALRDSCTRLLGYVPDYLANELAVSGSNAASLEVSVERVNLPPAPLHHRLLCRFRLPDDVGGKLFRGDSYRTISRQAWPTAA